MTESITASKPAAVVCTGVGKTFGDGDNAVRALDDVDLTVASGEMTLLVGPSGCGKTTLISIIAGLLDPTEGDVILWNVNQTKLRPSQRLEYRRKNIGFVFQQYNLLPALNAEENAAVPLIIAGLPRPKAIAKAVEILDLLGMANRRKAYPNTLSGGQQQRVAIARALVHEPKLMVCDEPTAALDAHSGQTTMELLKKVAVQADRAVIVVTHDSRVFRFGDRIVAMSDGRVEQISRNVHGEQMPEPAH
jgi:putative ABC transport system ATP-binding protein